MTADANTSPSNNVRIVRNPPILIVTINRPQVRNAVDGPTAAELAQVFKDFEQDAALSVAILTGSNGHFCAGADLKAVASGDPQRTHNLDKTGSGPMGMTHLSLNKPVIAAISGYCVAGGLELALWCDLRVADSSAIFGVFCRRFGVPLIDGGSVRLPRLIGQSHALDLILTGRPVDAEEAARIGLANRLVASGQALTTAITLAEQIAALPQQCLRNDRRSALDQWALSEADALRYEFDLGMNTLSSGETLAGAQQFNTGQGRHGQSNDALHNKGTP